MDKLFTRNRKAENLEKSKSRESRKVEKPLLCRSLARAIPTLRRSGRPAEIHQQCQIGHRLGGVRQKLQIGLGGAFLFFASRGAFFAFCPPSTKNVRPEETPKLLTRVRSCPPAFFLIKKTGTYGKPKAQS